MSPWRLASDVMGRMLVFPCSAPTRSQEHGWLREDKVGATDQRAQTFQYGKSGGRLSKTRSVMCIAEATLLHYYPFFHACDGHERECNRAGV